VRCDRPDHPGRTLTSVVWATAVGILLQAVSAGQFHQRPHRRPWFPLHRGDRLGGHRARPRGRCGVGRRTRRRCRVRWTSPRTSRSTNVMASPSSSKHRCWATPTGSCAVNHCRSRRRGDEPRAHVVAVEYHLDRLPLRTSSEPTARGWTVRPGADGTCVPDWADTEPDPVRVPTIPSSALVARSGSWSGQRGRP